MSAEIAIRITGEANTEFLDRVQARLEQLGPLLQKALDFGASSGGGGLDKVRETAERVVPAVEKIAPAAAKARDEFGRFVKTGEEGGKKVGDGLNQTKDKAEGARKGFLDLGRAADVALGSLAANAITKVTSAIASLPGFILGLASSFDSAYAKIRAGTGATGETLAGLQDSFRSVLSTVPADAGTAGQVIADLNTRLGATGPHLEGLARQVLQLQALGFDTSVTTVTRTFGDWGISTDRQSSALDRLFAVSQATGPSVDRIGQLLVQYGAPLRQLGFGFEESAAMMGKWEKEGVNTELVMGSLRIAVGKFAQDGVPLREGLDATIKKIQALGPGAAATSLAMETFGARAGADMAAAVLEGKFAIDELMTSLESSESIASAADAALTFGQRWQIVKNQVLTAIEPILSKVGAIAGRVVQVAGNVITAAQPLIDLFAKDIVSAVDALLPAMPTLDQLRNSVASVAVPLLMLRDVAAVAFGFLASHRELLLGLAVTVGVVLTAAFVAAAAAAWTAAAPILAAAAPVIALGVAVGALAAAWAGNWGGIREQTAAVVEALKGYLGGLVQVFASIFTGNLAGIFEGYRTMVSSIFGEGTASKLDGVAATFAGWRDRVVEVVAGLRDRLVGSWQGVVDSATGVRDRVVGAWQGLVAGVSGAVAGVRAAVMGWVQEHQQGLLAAVGAIVVAVGLMTAPLWLPVVAMRQVSEAWSSNWNGIRDTVTGVVASIQGHLAIFTGLLAGSIGGGAAVAAAQNSEAISLLASETESGLGSLGERWTTWKDSVVETVTGMVDSTVGTISGLWEQAQSLFSSGVQAVVDLVNGLRDSVQSTWEQLRVAVSGTVAGLQEWLTSTWVNFTAWFIALKERLASAIATTWAWIRDTVVGIVGPWVSWLLSLWSRAASFLGGILTKVMTAFSRAWTWIRTTVSKVATSLANAVIKTFHWLGQKVGLIWDTLSELFARAWNGILEIFRSAAQPIVTGVAGLFTKIAEIARDGMTAVGGIVGKVMSAIADKLSGLAPMLGPFAGALTTITDKMKAGGAGLLSSVGDGLSALISKIKGGVGDVVAFFKGKIEGARERVSQLFGGGPEQLADDSGSGSGADAPPDLGLEGGGDAGLPGEGGGGGGKATKDPAAKKPKKEPKKEDPKKKAQDLAKTMADIAKKVFDAQQTALEALRFLMKTDIPGEDVWGPKLDQMQVFITGALSRMQQTGLVLFEKVGELEDGAQLVDTRDAQAIEASSDLMGGVIDTVSKASSFLQSLVRARFPDQEKVDSALGQVGALIEKIRDRSIALSEPFRDEQTATAFAAAGEGLGVWGDLWMKLSGAAVQLGENSEAADKAPAALESVGLVLDKVIAIGGAIVARLQAALPDETDREQAMDLSERTADTVDTWISVAGRLAGIAEGLQKVPLIPAGVGEHIDRFLMSLANAGGRLVSGLRASIPGFNEQQDALELSERTASAIDAWLKPAASLAKAASDLRRVIRIPEGAAEAVGRFWNQISAIAGEIFVKLARSIPNPTDQVEALGVSQALSAALGAAVEVASKTAATIRGMVDLPEVPEGALDRVRDVLGRTSQILASFLVGPGYNLLTDTERTQKDFGVVQTLIKVLQDGVSLVSQVAGLGKDLAEAQPVDEADVERALTSADMVRAMVERFASAYRVALEQSGRYLEDVQEEVGEYGSMLKETLAAFGLAAKIEIAKVKPIDEADVTQAMQNGSLVAHRMRLYAEMWHLWLEEMKLDVAKVSEQIKTYAGVLKEAIGASDAAAKIGIGEIQPLDEAQLDRALTNASLVERAVRFFSDRWHQAMVAAERVAKTVAEETKAYAAQLKETLGIAETAGKFSLAEVLPLDPAQLDLALANAEKVRAKVQGLAASWAEAIRQAGRDNAAVAEENDLFGKAVGGALGLAKDASELVLAGVQLISEADISRVIANAQAVYAAVSREAAAWAAAIRLAGRDMGSVVDENEAFTKTAGTGVDLVGKVLDLMSSFAEKGSKAANVAGIMPRIRAQLVTILQELALVYDQVEAQAGTLKRALEASNVVGPAAEALSKVLGALSFENLMKSPLVDTKLRSGFMKRVTERRLDALAKQMTEGIRRTVRALVDGLVGIDVPDGLDAGLDRIASVYERIVAVLERIRELSAPDPAKIREIVALAALLAASIPAAAGPGGAAGGSRLSPGGGGTTPGLVAGPDPFAGGLSRGPSLRPPFGGGPGGATLPVDPTPREMSADIVVPVTVQLDSEQIGAVQKKIIHQRNIDITTGPQGG